MPGFLKAHMQEGLTIVQAPLEFEAEDPASTASKMLLYMPMVPVALQPGVANALNLRSDAM